MPIQITPKKSLTLFIIMTIFLLAQAVWWISFMAILVDEKVELAKKLDASPDFISTIHKEETARQIMVGMEGVVFLLVLAFGLWLVHKSIVRLQKLQHHQQNFMMAVTHELKTPLSSLNIYLDTLQSPKISETDKAAIIPKMKEDIHRLRNLVDNVLEASRYEQSRPEQKKERINLTALVSERLTDLKRAPNHKLLKLHQSLSPDVYIYGNRKSITRVLDALLGNAVKYNTNPTVIIDVTLSTSNDDILLKITDNGIGLEKKEQRAVFDRFYRVGNELTRDFDGTGLGLYLSREIIRAHGGDISVHSDGLGKGTTFTITLKKESHA